jgi:UTP-glucose-1-phosphate uridylyltransferase
VEFDVIEKCLFPAAGYGTRFLPATKSMPKEMLPIVDKPLIQYGVEEALEALSKSGNLVKRPVMVDAGRGVAVNGIKEEEWGVSF